MVTEASAHRRVLVVDDDAGSRAAVARDGEEATPLLTSWRPDLAIGV